MGKKVVIVTASIVALLAAGDLFVISAGKPIGSDVSIVGQGKPAIVLAYENYSPAGGEALSSLREVRDNYDSRLDFVVADMGTPQGRDFANRHQLIDGVAVFLDQSGKPLQVTRIPPQEDQLNQLLESMLDEVE